MSTVPAPAKTGLTPAFNPPPITLNVSENSAFERVPSSAPAVTATKRKIDTDGFAVPTSFLSARDRTDLVAKKKKEGPEVNLDTVRTQIQTPPPVLTAKVPNERLSVYSGKPLSPETIAYAERMKRLIDEANMKRPEQEAIRKFNEAWKLSAQKLSLPGEKND